MTIPRLSSLILSLGFIAAISACRSPYAPIAPKLPESYFEVGQGSAESCGLLFGPIPIRVNNRTFRAYDRALENSGGAVGLTNTTVTDSWFWTPIGVFLCTEVTGTGVREQE